MNVRRRDFLTGAAAATILSREARAGVSEVITPEAFGARGDGRTNDTDAFAAMSAHVNSRGGGTIVLRPVTYIVGKNLTPAGGSAGYLFAPGLILHFLNCQSLAIRGNGATLRTAPGLRFGTFEPRTGHRLEHAMPFTKPGFSASPYFAMIHVEGCAGLVEISDIELDGNLGSLDVGGQYGDRGWQIPGSGILLVRNLGAERLARIHSHHHPLDGLMITGTNARSASSTITGLRCDFNGRQGCSVTAGRNYAFRDCHFNDTGRGGLASAPGAGVDIEAEGRGIIRNLSFAGCEFSNNVGVGMVADSGDSADVSFDQCRFVGTTSWSAWPKKPGFRFSNCQFVGSLARVYGDPDPARAAQFVACDFRDDPALSSSGRVYLGGSVLHPIVNVPDGPNTRFERCRFVLTREGGLPMTTAAVYSDCEMSQRNPLPSRPRGLYLGSDSLSGAVDLSGSTIRGQVTLNGRTLPLSG